MTAWAAPLSIVADPLNIVSVAGSPARVVVSVSGELDRPGIARLRTELAWWRQAGALEVRLDLSGVPRCDPSLARSLAWARTQLRGYGADLIITGVGDEVLAELAAACARLAAFPG